MESLSHGLAAFFVRTTLIPTGSRYIKTGVGHTLCCSGDDFLSDKRAVDANATTIRRRTGATDSHAAFGEIIDGTENLIGANVLSLH